jgi:uncharacterized membrane protein YphA (DoxX/SURF4 family)
MNLLMKLTAANVAFTGLLDHLRSPVLLATRLYIGWQFWPSGMPGARILALLLICGILTRPCALGAFGVLGIALGSMLLAVGTHSLWGLALLNLVVFGPGQFAVDAWLEHRLARRCRPFMTAPPA